MSDGDYPHLVVHLQKDDAIRETVQDGSSQDEVGGGCGQPAEGLGPGTNGRQDAVYLSRKTIPKTVPPLLVPFCRVTHLIEGLVRKPDRLHRWRSRSAI